MKPIFALFVKVVIITLIVWVCLMIMICVFLDLSSYNVLCLCRFVLSPVNTPSAGHTVSVDELESYLNRALSTTPHNLLLFLQDKVYRIYIYTLHRFISIHFIFLKIPSANILIIQIFDWKRSPITYGLLILWLHT